MVIEIERTRSLDTPFAPEQLYGAIYGGERNAHKFIITGTRDGAEITLSGTVTAKFLRADNVDVALTGTIEGGKACVTLGDECYAVPGRYKLAIFVTSGTETLCVYAAIGNSDRTAGSSTVDGGNIIPSVSDLIAQINAAVATIPASYSDLMAGIAGTYDASKTYAVGDYAWYNGVLYKCTTAITTAETWTAAHWSRAVLGDDTSGLKSAIDQNTDLLEVISDGLDEKVQWSETAVTLLMQILEKAVFSQDLSAKMEQLSEELEYVPVTGWTITNALTGISNSNSATVVSNNAEYIATLTSDDPSKNVGEITVTMNSVDISQTVVNENVITIPAVTGDVVIRCSAVSLYTLVPAISNAPNITTFVYSKNSYAYSLVYENSSSITGGKLTCTVEPEKMTGFNVSLWLLDGQGQPYKYTGSYNPDNVNVSGTWTPHYDSPGTGSSYPTCAGSFTVDIPEGCKVFAWIRTSVGTVIDTEHITTDAERRDWAKNGGVVFTLEG